MKHLVTLSLLAGALALPACDRADDLDVAIAPVVQGAPIDGGAGSAGATPAAANAERDPLVAAGHGDAAAAAPDATAAESPAGTPADGFPALEDAVSPPPAPTISQAEPQDPATDPATGTGTDAPTETPTEIPTDEPIGDTEEGETDEPPLVEEAPADPNVALPELKDGVWYTTFDYLGSFDSGMMAIAEDSVMAQHAEKSLSTGQKGIPLAVLKMDQQIVELEGYMIPLKFEKGNVRTFYLSRYMMSCCFGMLPKANEVVEVEMTNEDGALYDAYMPIIVKGLFEVHPDGADSEYLRTVFTMKGQDYRFSDEW